MPRDDTPALVVQVTDYGHICGGPTRVAIDLCRLLHAAGVEVRFFAGCGPLDPAIRDLGIPACCLGQDDLLAGIGRPETWLRGLWNRTAADGFARFLADLPRARTVIHIHQTQKCLSSSVIATAKRLGFRVVLHVHDYFAACPNGCYFHHGRQSPCRLTPLSLACCLSNCDQRSYAHKAWRVLRSGIERAAGVYRRLDRVIAVSRSARDLVLTWLPELEARTCVLGNPVRVPSAPEPVARHRRGALFVGRFVREKGIEDAVEACRVAGVHLTLVGDGPLAPQLRELPADRVCVTGWIDPDEVLQRMHGARCLLFPSRYREPQGLVVPEALACGLPVLASRHAGSAEYVDHGSNGFLLPPQSPEQWSEPIAELERDDALTERMSRAATGTPDRLGITGPAYIARLKALYAELLRDQPQRARGATRR